MITIDKDKLVEAAQSLIADEEGRMHLADYGEQVVQSFTDERGRVLELKVRLEVVDGINDKFKPGEDPDL
jgi:hypothetical protein